MRTGDRLAPHAAVAGSSVETPELWRTAGPQSRQIEVPNRLADEWRVFAAVPWAAPGLYTDISMKDSLTGLQGTMGRPGGPRGGPLSGPIGKRKGEN